MPVVLRWLLRQGPTNPITVRLVQNGSRRAKHAYVRSIYLAVLIVVLLWSLVATTGAGDLDYRLLARAGASSFVWIAYLQVVLICVLSPVFMAGAIAQEASPKTWDILLTTPLTRAQLVLGNLLGRLFFVLALLVASLPLFALTQYFGGVPGSSIFASYLIAGCAALLVGSVAVSLSVSRVVGRRAVFAFYVAVVSFLGLTLAVDVWLHRGGAVGVTAMTPINPFLAMRALLNPSGYPRGGAGASWAMRHPVAAWCWGSALISVVLVSLSAVTVRRGGVQELVRGRSAVPWYRRVLRLGGAGAEFRPPRTVWHNPIAWREAAARNATLGRIAARWSFIALGGIVGVWLIGAFHTGGLDAGSFRFALLSVVWTELAVIVLVAINMSATAVSREREDGTLDLILTTPITPAMYLAGKLRGLIAYLLPMLAVPLGTIALASGYVMIGGLGRGDGVMLSKTLANGNTIEVPVVLPEAAVLVPIVVVPFVAFCVMVGLSWSLRSKGTIGSVVGAFGIVVAVGGTLGLCGVKSSAEITLVGPVLAGLSPASIIRAAVEPAGSMAATVLESSLMSARVGLAIGAALAGGIYLAIVYGIRVSMVRTFDMTVRKLSGTR